MESTGSSTTHLDAEVKKPEKGVRKVARRQVARAQLSKEQARRILQVRAEAKAREGGRHRRIYYVWYFANVIWAVLAFPVGISLITYIRTQRRADTSSNETRTLPPVLGSTIYPPEPVLTRIAEHGVLDAKVESCEAPGAYLDDFWKPPFTDPLENFPKAPPSIRPIFCLFNHSSYQRHEEWAFRTGFINGYLCTHLIYSSAKLAGDELSSLNPAFDIVKEGFRNLALLKIKYLHLKVLISFGGYEKGTSILSRITANETRRSGFVAYTMSWLKEYDYDGINIEWKYPGGRCGSSRDASNLVQLLQEFRGRFGEKYLMSIMLPSSETLRTHGYDLRALSVTTDYFIVETHNLYDAGSNLTHCSTPLDAEGPSLKGVLQELLHELPVNSSHKVCFSLSFSGVSFKIKPNASSDHPERRESAGPGLEGNFTRTRGRLAFFETCELHDGHAAAMDYKGICSYKIYGQDWIGYESEFSLATKLPELFRKEEFKDLCVAVWDIDLDDFKDACKMGLTPLLKAVHAEASGFAVTSSSVS